METEATYINTTPVNGIPMTKNILDDFNYSTVSYLSLQVVSPIIGMTATIEALHQHSDRPD